MSQMRKKISTILPSELLAIACDITNSNQTDTIVAGLRALIAQDNRQKLIEMRGKIKTDFDLNKFRQRHRL